MWTPKGPLCIRKVLAKSVNAERYLAHLGEGHITKRQYATSGDEKWLDQGCFKPRNHLPLSEFPWENLNFSEFQYWMAAPTSAKPSVAFGKKQIKRFCFLGQQFITNRGSISGPELLKPWLVPLADFFSLVQTHSTESYWFLKMIWVKEKKWTGLIRICSAAK